MPPISAIKVSRAAGSSSCSCWCCWVLLLLLLLLLLRARADQYKKASGQRWRPTVASKSSERRPTEATHHQRTSSPGTYHLLHQLLQLTVSIGPVCSLQRVPPLPFCSNWIEFVNGLIVFTYSSRPRRRHTVSSSLSFEVLVHLKSIFIHLIHNILLSIIWFGFFFTITITNCLNFLNNILLSIIWFSFFFLQLPLQIAWISRIFQQSCDRASSIDWIVTSSLNIPIIFNKSLIDLCSNFPITLFLKILSD